MSSINLNSDKFRELQRNFVHPINHDELGRPRDAVNESLRVVALPQGNSAAKFEDYSGVSGGIKSFFSTIVRWFRRTAGCIFGVSAADKNLQNISKAFQESVASIFGGANKIPAEVKKALGVHAYAGGRMRPLTSHRIRIVNNTIHQLWMEGNGGSDKVKLTSNSNKTQVEKGGSKNNQNITVLEPKQEEKPQQKTTIGNATVLEPMQEEDLQQKTTICNATVLEPMQEVNPGGDVGQKENQIEKKVEVKIEEKKPKIEIKPTTQPTTKPTTKPMTQPTTQPQKTVNTPKPSEEEKGVPIAVGVKSFVRGELQRGNGLDSDFLIGLKRAFEMLELKSDNFLVNQDYSDFVAWLGRDDADLVCIESQATSIEVFIYDLVAGFVFSKNPGTLNDPVPQEQVNQVNDVEIAQIKKLSNPTNEPPDNEYLGNEHCGIEYNDRSSLSYAGEPYSVFDVKTNTKSSFFTYPQGGGDGQHCFFLSTLRHLNITPSNANAKELRKVLGEAFEQLKQAVVPQLWAAKERLEQKKTDLSNLLTSATDENQLKIKADLKSVEDELKFIAGQLGPNPVKPNIQQGDNDLSKGCPVRYADKEFFFVGKDPNDVHDRVFITEMFKTEQNPGTKVLDSGSGRMADVAYAALLPMVLKRPVIIVDVDLKDNEAPVENTRAGQFTKFTKNVITGDDYGNQEPVYIRYQRGQCYTGVGYLGHFEAMVPEQSTKLPSQMDGLFSLLGLNGMEGTGFLTVEFVKKQLTQVLDARLPTDGWKKHCKLQKLNQLIQNDKETQTLFQGQLKNKLDAVKKNITAGVAFVTGKDNKNISLADEFNEWLGTLCDQMLNLGEQQAKEQPKN